jgi:large subunit ribosomal protein L3
MIHGMLGRKLGMMRLYDGGGRVRAVTVVQLGPNRVTQLRTEERDRYSAVQVGFTGNRKRLNRPERGHLRAAGAEAEVLAMLREFPVDDVSDHELGEVVTCEQFVAGSYVNVSGTSKGRGFAGGVKRWGFHGGPKTHGQSDRHRAPGSVGAGTTPGKVWKGQKMAGHMGARTVSVLNLLVVATDPARDLLFVEGSVPGPPRGLVEVTPGRKSPLEGYEPPELAPPDEAVAELEPEPPEAAEELAEEAAAEEAAVIDGAEGSTEAAPEEESEPAVAEAESVEEPEAADEAVAAGEAEPDADAEPAAADEKSE